MGYWDMHPMGGDSPSDMVYNVYDIIWPEWNSGEPDYLTDMWCKTIREKASKCDIRHLIDEFKKNTDVDFYFVLPFEIIELGIRITNKDLSNEVKEMIGDGGASRRNYGVEDKGDWKKGEFNSPADYADQLRELWDHLMIGRITSEQLQSEVGLFDAISKLFESGDGGMINKK